MKSIAVIGLGQFGYQLAITLSQKGFEVVGIDTEEDLVYEVKDLITQSVVLDSTDEKAMRSANVDHVDKAVVAIGSNVQSSLLTTALLQRMGIGDIYVRAINGLQENILRSMGVEHILRIEGEMGSQVANTIASESVGRYVAISDRHSLLEIMVPKGFVGSTLKDLHLRSQYKVNIVGIKTRVPLVDDDGEISFDIRMTDVPDPNYPLGKNDVLVISGTDDNLSKFIRMGRQDD